MAFRSGNRRSFGGGSYGSGGGGAMGRNMNPWDNQSSAGGGNFGNMRQGGGGGGGQGMNAEALTLANNLLNNLLRNQNPPSLLDLPRGGGGAGRLPGGRGATQVGNRPGNRNRRMQGGFNRGQKTGSNKQGGGIRKQNAFDRAKKLLAKNSNKKKDSSPGDKDKKKNESFKESIYADVPNDMFYCHLCKKHMWDSNSFENHIKGRTHLMMREGIEESYRLKANMIRQEAKIAEQLKLIELDRLKRMGKSGGKSHQREYCTMCDLNFHGHLSAHRKSEGHLTLKKFLHPKCLECNREFPTRIEFDTHLLTPEHLKKAAERNTKVGERKRNTLTILTEEDELKDVKPPTKKKKKVEPKKEGEEGEEEVKENGEAVEGEEKKEGEEAGEEEQKDEEDPSLTVIEDPEDCILDFNDGDEIPIEIDNRVPKYNWQRPVGASLISKLECHECSLCGRFFDTEKTAEIHSRTMYHHRQFVKFINEKASDTKIAQKRAAAALEENERKKRKLEEAEESKTEENGDKANDSELYDPSEATADDEDVEMNENPEEEQENGIKAEDECIEETNGVAKVEDAVMKEEEIKKEEEKVEAKPESAPTTPKAATTPQKQAAAAKSTPAARGGAQAKGTPRGRGRGRYNRY